MIFVSTSSGLWYLLVSVMDIELNLWLCKSDLCILVFLHFCGAPICFVASHSYLSSKFQSHMVHFSHSTSELKKKIESCMETSETKYSYILYFSKGKMIISLIYNDYVCI